VKVPSEPEALVAFFGQLGLPLTRIGLEAGPLSQWLHAGLTAAGFEAVLLETRHVKAALSAMVVKTDLCGRPRVVKRKGRSVCRQSRDARIAEEALFPAAYSNRSHGMPSLCCPVSS
jgi:transposase